LTADISRLLSTDWR